MSFALRIAEERRAREEERIADAKTAEAALALLNERMMADRLPCVTAGYACACTGACHPDWYRRSSHVLTGLRRIAGRIKTFEGETPAPPGD